MINFDEEVKRFQPSPEVEDTEDAIHGASVMDITDIIDKIISKSMEDK